MVPPVQLCLSVLLIIIVQCSCPSQRVIEDWFVAKNHLDCTLWVSLGMTTVIQSQL